MKLYPTILTESTFTAQTQLDQLQAIEQLDVVHWDVINGIFAEAFTLTPADLPDLNFGRLQCDLHLITEEPQDYVHEAIVHRSALPIRAIIGQVERMSSQLHFLKLIKNQGWLGGLSLDLFTPVDTIGVDSWSMMDFVQLMAVENGAQGRSFS